MINATSFDELRIGLATSADIRAWSYGEVKKPETINYPHPQAREDGLFGEQIFGPSRDWECSCGKFKRVRFKGIVCERCGVEVTKSSVRRERMATSSSRLPSPTLVLQGCSLAPSGTCSTLAPKDLEKVIYFAAYMVISVDDEARHADMPGLENELRSRDQAARAAARRPDQHPTPGARAGARRARGGGRQERPEEEGPRRRRARDGQIRKSYDEQIKRSRRCGTSSATQGRRPEAGGLGLPRAPGPLRPVLRGLHGRRGDQGRLEAFDLQKESDDHHEEIASGKGGRRRSARSSDSASSTRSCRPATRRPRWCSTSSRSSRRSCARWSSSTVAAFATSDLNDLYRRVINRNNVCVGSSTWARRRSSSTTRSACFRRRRRAVDNGRRGGRPSRAPATAR